MSASYHAVTPGKRKVSLRCLCYFGLNDWINSRLVLCCCLWLSGKQIGSCCLSLYRGCKVNVDDKKKHKYMKTPVRMFRTDSCPLLNHNSRCVSFLRYWLININKILFLACVNLLWDCSGFLTCRLRLVLQGSQPCGGLKGCRHVCMHYPACVYIQ